MKKFNLFFVVIFIIFSFSLSSAGDFRAGRSIKISEKDTIHNDLFAAAQYINIYGYLKGDAWIAGQTISIKNIVDHSLFAAAQNIDIDGKIGKSALLLGSSVRFKGDVFGGLKCAGGIINIDGKIGRDLIIAGGQVSIEKDAVIEGDLILGGGEAIIDGTVKGNIIGSVSKLYFSGKAEKNVDLTIEDDIIMQQGCMINGDFYYKAKKQLDINKNYVKGTIKYEKFEHKEWDPERYIVLFKIFSFFAALICALIILPFTRHKIKPIFEKLDTTNWITLGIGFLGAVIVPIGTIILIALIVTIPVAFIIGCLYCIFLYIGKIFAGIYIGEKLLFLVNKKEPNIYLSALTGLAVLYAVFLIPYLGNLVYIVTIIYGFGIMMKFFASLFTRKEVKEV